MNDTAKNTALTAQENDDNLEWEEPIVFCLNCGESEPLANIGNYANGSEYRCRCCGYTFIV